MKLSNRVVTVSRSPVYFGNMGYAAIDRLVDTMCPDHIFILVDVNTRKHCLPVLLGKTVSLEKAKILETGEGEAAKSLENARRLWIELMASGAGRSSLLINLGGGIVSDLGGFVAAGFKRGIRYINIPTSLIGQADAAIGGKTAVNLGNVKNTIGFFHMAQGVYIIPEFLKTLPPEHLRSGLSEIIKSALISDEVLWRKLSRNPVNEILQLPVDSHFWISLVAGAVKFKNKVVMQDPCEKRLRKVLNFGHTMGHAFEGLSLMGSGTPMLHGDAVAAGMICAASLSHMKTGLAPADLETISTYLRDGFPCFSIDLSRRQALLDLMSQDKKNVNGKFLFTLISKPGHPLVNISCNQEEVLNALDYFNSP